MGRLDGKIAVVTGGAKSLGRAFADALAGEGAAVAIGDIADGSETAAAIAARHGTACLFHPLDVADESSVADFVAWARQSFGTPDILINNAAVFADARLGPYHQMTVEELQRIMGVNVIGSFLTIKHIGPLMAEAGRGRIVNIGSGTAYKGMPGMAPYVASKAAILGLTRSLARELGPSGVTVNTLAMGLIESDSIRGNEEHMAYTDRVLASRSIPRAGTQDDPIGALIFLASDESAFMTGQTVMIDGGSVNV